MTTTYMQNRKSFTLVELVVYMGILALLLVVFIDMFALLINKQLETEGLSATQADDNYLLSRLTYDFGRASEIVSPATAGSSSAALQLIINSSLYEIYSSSNNLIASMSGQRNQLNSSETSISNVSFRRLGVGNKKDVIQVKGDISSKAKKQSGYEVTHFSTTFGIREK